MKRSPRLFFAIALLIVTGVSGCRGYNIAMIDDNIAKGSNRIERNGWIYVQLEGAPSRIGFQHGYLLATEIGDLLRVMKPFLLHTSKRDWTFYRETAEQMLWPKIEKEYQEEIDGIVSGAA